jgi:Carbon-nitrogen hydrolase
VTRARPVTHLGLGQAEVEKVASNRRILGPDGKVQYVRYTACPDPKVRDMPVGTIDPMLRMISLWDRDTPVVALTYYATHPQSYYRTGKANPDFPGIARDRRQEATGVPHVHFDGAGGNIGAGKWNDGSPENRQILADRVAAGMARAWEATTRTPIAAADLGWDSVPVALPPAPHLDEGRLLAALEDKAAKVSERAKAAGDLAWLRRCKAGDTIDVACLRLGPARVLHLPGELFVEYQLAAQAMRSDRFIAVAAYGDYGPGYIGTEVAYSQGGYETRPSSSLVAPSVERVLTDAIKRLLRDGWTTCEPREELRPKFSYHARGGRDGKGGFVIEADEREGLDGWWTKTVPVKGGMHYRFHAARKVDGVALPRQSAVVRIVWKDDSGGSVSLDAPAVTSYLKGWKPTAEPEFPTDKQTDAAGWTEVSDTYRAPSKATRAVIELHLQWAPPGGRIEWSEVSLEQTSPPAGRKVRLAAAHFRPSGQSARTNREEAAPLVAEAARQKADLIVLGETLPYFGLGKNPVDTAEKIPGPTTDYFGALAKQHNLYIVLSVYERDQLGCPPFLGPPQMGDR